MSRLNEIKQRWAAATDGPWRAQTTTGKFGSVAADADTGCDDAENVDAYEGHLVAESCTPANRTAIAAAPDDVAWLVVEVERLRALVELTYREGWHDGYDATECAPGEAWLSSGSRDALLEATP